jgi:hypothetical protein
MRERLICLLAAVAITASAQATADVPPFSADEIAIYRDFLLHYPEPLSEMIGMEDTTVTFTAASAFGDEPNPPKLNLEIPAYSGRLFPPEIMALTDEKVVTARMAAERKVDSGWRTHLTLSEIAFDSKHEHAVFFYSSMQGRAGTSGTVVYHLKSGQWIRKKRILNFRQA